MARQWHVNGTYEAETLPAALEAALSDDYDGFLKARAAFLDQRARALIAETVVPANSILDEADDDDGEADG